MAASYYQLEAEHGDFYRNSLKFLGVADMNKIAMEEKQKKAFSIGISALLAKVGNNFVKYYYHRASRLIKSGFYQVLCLKCLLDIPSLIDVNRVGI